ncbi:MAG TPA: hypothetical protein VGT02_15630 [Methylomirabilota bacterium]|jgi:hypothetical protein|nr:hypothetical protein [Methylomirabilota bacterium]
MISERTSDDSSGVEFHRDEGTTRYGEAYRVRYLLDVGTRRRWRVVSVGGSVVESGWEDVGVDLEAAARVWGPAWSGRTEGEVRREFGVPLAVSEVGGARTLWYVRARREVYGVLLRDGLLTTAFRISEPDFERLRARNPPH